MLLLTGVACSSEPDAAPLSSGSAGTAGAPVAVGGSAGAAGVSGAPSGGSTIGGTSGGGVSGAGDGGTPAIGGGGGGGGAGPQMEPREVLYRTNCLPCHGELGVGTALAPDIQHPIRDYATWVVRNGRAMSAFPMPMMAWATDKLSDSDLMLIFDYLDTPPKGTTGEALFRDFCANCHGADARGGPVNHNITNETDEIPRRVRNGAHAGEFEEREEFMPVFPPSILSDAEVQLIQAYVESL